MRQIVMEHMRPMLEAQISNAMGVKYLVFRDKNGTFKPVTDVKDKLSKEGVELEVWEKFPNVQAFSDLMDRTFDKPKQHVDVEGEFKGGILLTWKQSE